jgi:tRNA pseudouridine55 synthase
MYGLLNIHKPPGVTSRDVVNRVQRLVRPAKVGHAGTLDPLATGVLVVAVGPATRLVEYVQRMPKTYRATFLLGRTSDTEDVEGEVHELPDAARPTEEAIRAAMSRLIGTIEQVPPAYSALKVGGVRAYDLARRGEPVDLAPRTTVIQSFDLLSYAYPELAFRVRCGSGTYVRTLGRDLARSLGTDAVMSVLVREAIGPFSLEAALDCQSLTLTAVQSNLLSPLTAVGELPQLVVTAQEQTRLAKGQSIDNRWQIDAPECAAVSEQQILVAIVTPVGPNALRAAKNFVSPD